MARLHRLSTVLLLALLSVRLALSADPPQAAPSPALKIGADLLSPPPGAPDSPSPLPQLSSPPAPPPDLAPGSSPTPSPAPSLSKKSPAPVPATESSDVMAEKSYMNEDADDANESTDGLKGGQKAGIVLGVIAGVCLVGFGGMLYRKRQQNIQRSQYGYAARGGIL